MWTRSVGNGIGLELQRGRARAGAECKQGHTTQQHMIMASTGPRPRGRGMPFGKCGVGFRCVASTGPRPRGRGMPVLTVNQFIRVMLQRGRARAGAECAPCKDNAGPTASGFNGAAPARARNAIFFVPPRAVLRFASTGPRPRGRGMMRARAKSGMRMTRLQRGRARAGAECDFTGAVQEGAGRASTGPRPRGRGMILIPPCLLASQWRLQRGRARAGAEWGFACAEGLTTFLLQRGRARAGAE